MPVSLTSTAQVSSSNPSIQTPGVRSREDSVIFKVEDLQYGNGLITKYANIKRLVSSSEHPATMLGQEITLKYALDCLTNNKSFNDQMKEIVLSCINKEQKSGNKIEILEKGLAFLETEKLLTKLVDKNQITLENARKVLKHSLEFGCQSDFSIQKLNAFNELLTQSEIGDIKEKANEFFNKSVVQNSNKSVTDSASSLPSEEGSVENGRNIDIKATFDALKESFGQETIKKKIDDLMRANGDNYDKKLFDCICKELKNLGVDTADFYEAWAIAISKTQGGKELQGTISLNFNDKPVDVNLSFTPQVKMSGFISDKQKLNHYSSAIQNRSLQKAGKAGNHAVNLWKQNIKIGDKSMQFLRHGCTRGSPEATKEILLNALYLQYGEDLESKEQPLQLKFTNVQLMTLGHIADREMPIEQIKAFEDLIDKNPHVITLPTKDEKNIQVKLEQPLLFNFGVNLQHFRKLENVLSDSKVREIIEERNLKSFKALFGEDFPNFSKEDGNKLTFGDDSVIQKALDSESDELKKNQIQILANQIIDIYTSNPGGLKDNPYALPTRVLALTNLLGYASSFNCKSGKDRTGICSMELTNLCAQMLAGGEISNPQDPISSEEQKNLQAIYKEGSSARDIARINTIFQKNLNIQEYLGFDVNGKRFGVDWKKSFEENVEQMPKAEVFDLESSSILKNALNV